MVSYLLGRTRTYPHSSDPPFDRKAVVGRAWIGGPKKRRKGRRRRWNWFFIGGSRKEENGERSRREWCRCRCCEVFIEEKGREKPKIVLGKKRGEILIFIYALDSWMGFWEWGK